MTQDQPWAEQTVKASHLDALYRYGEFVGFVLMWNALDFEAGRVKRCSVCFSTNRTSMAYDQSPNQSCSNCYGTTFHGGYRAIVYRPAIISDQNAETADTRRGELETDSVSLQTSADFFSRTGDFLLRKSGQRYQMQQMDTVDIRSGFEAESLHGNVGGVIPSARLEDPTSQAHRIPPQINALRATLSQVSSDWHLARGVGRQDVVRPGGYLVPPNL